MAYFVSYESGFIEGSNRFSEVSVIDRLIKADLFLFITFGMVVL